MYISPLCCFVVMNRLMALKFVLLNILAACVTADKLVRFAGLSVEVPCYPPFREPAYGVVVTYNWAKGSNLIAKYSVQYLYDTLRRKDQWFHESLGGRIASFPTKLRISDLTSSDNGQYTCTTMYDDSHMEKKSTLIVTDHPAINISNIRPPKVLSDVGKPVRSFLATCVSEVYSSENSEVYWRMGDTDLPEEMKVAGISVTGMYTIKVDLVVPQHLMTSHPNTLRVEFTCIVEIEDKTYESQPFMSRKPHPPSDVNIIGETVIRDGNGLFLTCDAPAYPKSTYIWKLAGKVVATGHEYGVRKMSRDMAGSYSCHADNKIGHSFKEVEIIVHFPPERVEITLDRATGSLRCEVVGGCRPAPKISWIMENGDVISDNKSTLTMLHKPVGIYECIAENDLGGSRAKFEWTPEFEALAQIANTQSRIYAVVGVVVAVFVVTAVLVFLGRKRIRRGRLCWNTYALNDGSSVDNRSQGQSVSERHDPKSDTSSSSVRYSPSLTDEDRESPSLAASVHYGKGPSNQLQWNDRNSVTVMTEMLHSRAEAAAFTRPYDTMPARMRERGERVMMGARARDDSTAAPANIDIELETLLARARHKDAMLAYDSVNVDLTPLKMLQRDGYKYTSVQRQSSVNPPENEIQCRSPFNMGGDGNMTIRRHTAV